jgi:hypothetical protein
MNETNGSVLGGERAIALEGGCHWVKVLHAGGVFTAATHVSLILAQAMTEETCLNQDIVVDLIEWRG